MAELLIAVLFFVGFHAIHEKPAPTPPTECERSTEMVDHCPLDDNSKSVYHSPQVK